MPNNVDVTSSNFSPLLCGHIKKKKKKIEECECGFARLLFPIIIGFN